MDLSRRNFLHIGGASALAMAPLPTVAAASTPRWMGCRQAGETFYATLFDSTGTILLNVPLPGRGHDLVPSPDGKSVVVMARRPDTFALVIDLTSGEIYNDLTASDGHHFYGHGCFSSDGNLFYTTENRYETGEGMIGVHDVRQNYALQGHFPSEGIGPHELVLMADGETLAIANGGIRTHPDTGRAKLNLATMTPSLTMVDRTSGTLRSRHMLGQEHHQLSIRHLAARPQGLALALQYEGPKRHRVPLLALYQEEELKLAETPEPVAKAMRNYAGSVTFDASGEMIALTCPRGNLVSFWSSDDGRFLGFHSARDVCGIVALEKPGTFEVTAGDLAFQASLTATGSPARFAETNWDNHLVSIA
jgi:uncharacterized protein